MIVEAPPARRTLGLGVLLMLCTGAYGVVPGSGLLILVLGFVALALDPLMRERPAELLPARMLVGYAVFNAVFLIYGLWYGLEGRAYLFHLYSLLCMCVAFAIVSSDWYTERSRPPDLARTISVLGLLLMLLGQWAQVKGWIKAPDDRFQSGGEAVAALRPGGFMNPNMTAAVALVLLYACGLHRRGTFTLASAGIFLLAATVIGLSQSRAALLALAIYLLIIGRHHPGRLLALFTLVAAGSYLAGWWDTAGLMFELIQRLTARFSGDESSSERAYVLHRAVEYIQRAPYFGNGYGSLVRSYGMGSHNQLAELLVNFGVFGGVLMLLAGALMLGPVSIMFIVVCLLPAFVFSHNYFDNAPLQAALGLALAGERWMHQRRGRS